MHFAFHGHHSYLREDFPMLLAVNIGYAFTLCNRSHIATTTIKNFTNNAKNITAKTA